MRVISGAAKGHKLKSLKGNNTRPTTDRVKESLFNIIAGYIGDADVLDLFSGTGSLGIEALSRGAESAVFVDSSRECARIIEENLIHTKLKEKAQIMCVDIISSIQFLASRGYKFDIIFLDPPYRKGWIWQTLKEIDAFNILRKNGIIAAEHDIGDEVPDEVDGLKLFRKQKYGNTAISLYLGDNK